MAGKRRAGRADRAGRAPVPPTARDPRLRPPSLGPPPVADVVIRPELSRREERRLRKRQQRRRLGLVGGIGVGALAVAGIVTVVIGVSQVVTESGSDGRTQSTVLLQLRSPAGVAQGSVLLAADPATEQGVELLIPGRLVSDVCGYGAQNFGSVLALPSGAAASRSALSSVLGGVTIDGSWVINETTFVDLIDRLQGVTVDVDTNVVERTAGGGGRILIVAGPQTLTGAQALRYATYHPPREGAAGVLARLHAVLDAMIQKLPPTENEVAALIRSLPKSAQSTIGAERLSNLLSQLRIYGQTEAGIFPSDLPVVPIDSGGKLASYRPDQSASGIKGLVAGHLANSVPENANKQHATVYLLNGVGVPGLVATACPKLAAAGFTYAGSRNAPRFSNARSEVDIFRDSDAEQGRALAKALGLPASDVRRSVINQTVAKFVVILGSDYRP